jgi:hypothetical protein
MTCDHCNKEFEFLEERKDPYIYEVYDETRYILVCEECYNSRHEEV